MARSNVLKMSDYDEGAFLRLLETERMRQRREVKHRREKRLLMVEMGFCGLILLAAGFCAGVLVGML